MRKPRLSVPFLLVALAGVLVWPDVARADLKVCNDTRALTGVAVGYRDQSGWVTEGWWRIPAGVCATIIDGDLTARFFYLYAEDADTGAEWRGPVFMCTSPREFKIEGVQNCFARGYDRTGFFEIDTGNQTNWQVRLSAENQTRDTEKQ